MQKITKFACIHKKNAGKNIEGQQIFLVGDTS